MYERFTDRARKVMQLANQEAQRFNHEYIGTEHILLGLVKEGSGVAANVLKNLDVDLRKIRIEVEKIVQTGPDMVTMGKLPQTPRAKKVIEYAMDEARMTGIPLTRLSSEDAVRLLQMEQELHKRVISQEQAITQVCKAVRRSRSGLKDPKRPTGAFLFCGPTGVGKTLLAKTLAEFMFGDEDAL
ncbi:MAG: Clp protease N-terminal domain-containing protein, partial [bacterium]